MQEFELQMIDDEFELRCMALRYDDHFNKMFSVCGKQNTKHAT